MCVIAVCSIARPTKEQVELMWDANPHGGGVAWREGPEANRVVRWNKGLELEEMQAHAKDLPFPFVLHFRIPTCGGSIRELTHPFPVEIDSPSKLEGETSEGVLFHNGSWSSWQHELKVAAIQGGWKLPRGRYSDSRAMAIMAAQMGPGVLELIGERICVLAPRRLDVFGTPWIADENILYSNLGWKSSRRSASTNSGFQQRGDQQVGTVLGGSSGGGRSESSGSSGGSIFTTPPASMAGAKHVKEASEVRLTPDPFGLIAPSRKQLRRLRQRQEKDALKRGLTQPGMIPTPSTSSV